MTGILCSLPIIGAPTAASSGAPTTFTVSRSPTTASASGTTGTLTTNTVTATPSGGTSPYAYEWNRVSGDRRISPTSENSAVTAFQRTSTSAGTAYSATYRCSVTDANGTVAHSGNVTVTITRTDSASGGGGGSGGGTFLGLPELDPYSDAVSSSVTATYTINSNGTVLATTAGSGSWNSSSSVGSSYEVKATAVSGDVPTSGTMDTWLSLSSNRSWSMTDTNQSNAVLKEGTIRLHIRLAGSTTTLDTADITITANALNNL